MAVFVCLCFYERRRWERGERESEREGGESEKKERGRERGRERASEGASKRGRDGARERAREVPDSEGEGLLQQDGRPRQMQRAPPPPPLTWLRNMPDVV